ncbi:tetratricopeptide repeat protein [Streptomyces sp. NPDC102360]|uniref:tetratricopeptide repeat protein n=1 Tax=Streptomyces sp. NPDC102360 TaxID=3366160 RepID=UPI0037FEA6AD
MAEPELSMQELIRRRRRVGFIARRAELASFRVNFEVPPGDERHRFLFHVHGLAGVGKTSLLKEMADVAREFDALTALVDEAVGSVPETLSELCSQFARQGHRMKDLERRLAVHRERRHEAELAAAAQDPTAPLTPSVGSATAVRAGLVGLGLVPGLGPFTTAADPDQLALGADKVRAVVSARLGNQDDVQLVMSPEKVLTPILLRELSDIAASVPWAVLFFDTYERTGPFLDAWLHELMTTGRHGVLPSNVVVVTAGQRPLDLARWGADAAVLETMPLDPFTDDEARALLAAKDVTDEPLVAKILNVTGGLPVLVSMLANGRPTSLEDIGDPSTAAATLFLKWEREDRRDVALACALPRRLDADVFRAAVDCADDEADALYGWLRGLPFVSDRAGRVQYHEVVRQQLLCLLRQRSPREWARRHTRLAEVFAEWRAEAEEPLAHRYRWCDWRWFDQRWRELRTAESYHRLCVAPKGALAETLRLAVEAIDRGSEADVRTWARMLVEAGEDTEAATVAQWGRDLLAACHEGGVAGALDLLLVRAELDARTQGVVRALRGQGLRRTHQYKESLAEFDRAIELGVGLPRAYSGRGYTKLYLGRDADALADFDRALELDADDVPALTMRAEALWFLEKPSEALQEVERALDLAPPPSEALEIRGVLLYELGRYEDALDTFGRLSSEDDRTRSQTSEDRARIQRQLGGDTEEWSHRDAGVVLAPILAQLVGERALHMRSEGRYAEAMAECVRALRFGGSSAFAHWNSGCSHRELGAVDRALQDYARALELQPGSQAVLTDRAELLAGQRRLEEALADVDAAIAGGPNEIRPLWAKGNILQDASRIGEALESYEQALRIDARRPGPHGERGVCLFRLGRHEEALAAFDRALELKPSLVWALLRRAEVLRALGEQERAMADWDRAVELAPTSARAVWERGEAHRLAGHYADALRDCDRVLELDDAYVPAHGGRGDALCQLGRYDEALAALSRALELEPDYAWAWRRRAEVHQELVMPDQAARDADRAIELAPAFALAFATRATVMVSAGLLDQALADLSRYEEMADDHGWAAQKRAWIHLLRGQAEAALVELRAKQGLGVEPDGEDLYLCCVALRMVGQLAASVTVAGWLTVLERDAGEYEQAVAVGCHEGASAARPLWRAWGSAGRVADPGDEAIVAAGLAEWSRLDSCLSDVLAARRPWDRIAQLVIELHSIAAAPGADRTRLAPRIARVEQARDAMQARFAAECARKQ